MERFRLRLLLLLLAVALSALAAAWYFTDGDETVEGIESETAPIVGLGEEEARRGPQMSTNAVTTTSGLQGTVPDTVGQNEATATSTLEGAGYRVRLMTRTVSTRREEGVVVQQLPTGGTRRIGTTVTIVVGRLP
ncbi:MAG: PASTA domain-containing protein [Gaiellaceae bacterium]